LQWESFRAPCDKSERLQGNPQTFKKAQSTLQIVVGILNPEVSTSDFDKVHPYLGARLQHHLLVLTPGMRSQSLIQTLGHLKEQNGESRVSQRPTTHSTALHPNLAFNIPAQLKWMRRRVCCFQCVLC